MRKWLAGGVRTHTTLNIMFRVLCGFGLWCAQTSTIVTSVITDHYNEYNNDEKVGNIVRITTETQSEQMLLEKWHQKTCSV